MKLISAHYLHFSCQSNHSILSFATISITITMSEEESIAEFAPAVELEEDNDVSVEIISITSGEESIAEFALAVELEEDNDVSGEGRALTSTPTQSASRRVLAGLTPQLRAAIERSNERKLANLSVQRDYLQSMMNNLQSNHESLLSIYDANAMQVEANTLQQNQIEDDKQTLIFAEAEEEEPTELYRILFGRK